MKPRLVLLEFHHLGDAILSFPFIRSALEKYDVWVCCRPSQKKIFEMVLPPGQILVWEPFWMRGKFWDRREIKEQGRRLQALEAEVAVCGWADPRVQCLMASGGIGRRVGFPVNRRNYFTWKASGTANRLWQGKTFQCLAGLFYGKGVLTDSLQRESWDQPHWRDWQQLGRALNLDVSMQTPWVSLPGLNSGTSSGKKTWLLHPGARLPEKRWSPEGFAEVVTAYLEPENYGWVCVVPADEAGALPPCLEKKRVKTHDWMALVQEVLKADAVLCHDSVVAHLAAALGKPVVALFGGRPSCWFKPYGNEHLVVESPRGESLGSKRSLRIEAGKVIEKMRAAIRIETGESAISVLGKDGDRN